MRIESFNLFAANKLPVKIARLDSNDELLSGNKLYKLRPWLQRAIQGKAGLLSCGGAWSNHLHALAAAGRRYGLPTAALVRGYQPESPTPTMRDCQQWGMQLIAVDRQTYESRYEADFAEPFLQQLKFPAIWVPEGGTSPEAVTACEAIGHELNQLLTNGNDFDSLWVAVGSGGTLAGLSRSLDKHLKLFAVPVMSSWQDVAERVAVLSPDAHSRIHWMDGASYGGFGRMNQSMREFMQKTEAINSMLLDPVYTAKVARRLYDAVLAGVSIGDRPMILHTGGLQGRRGMAC